MYTPGECLTLVIMASQRVKPVLSKTRGQSFLPTTKGPAYSTTYCSGIPPTRYTPQRQGDQELEHCGMAVGRGEYICSSSPPNPTPPSLRLIWTIVLQPQRLLPPILAGHGPPPPLPADAGLKDQPPSHEPCNRIASSGDVLLDILEARLL